MRAKLITSIMLTLVSIVMLISVLDTAEAAQVFRVCMQSRNSPTCLPGNDLAFWYDEFNRRYGTTQVQQEQTMGKQFCTVNISGQPILVPYKVEYFAVGGGEHGMGQWVITCQIFKLCMTSNGSPRCPPRNIDAYVPYDYFLLRYGTTPAQQEQTMGKQFCTHVVNGQPTIVSYNVQKSTAGGGEHGTAVWTIACLQPL